MEDEVTNMLAPTSSRSAAPMPGDSPVVPVRRPTLRRRNTFTRDSTMDSAASMGASAGDTSRFGSIKAGTSKGFFATQKKPAAGASGGDPVGHGGSTDTGMGGTDLNEKGEAVVAAADGGFTPFSGASLKRTKSFGGGAAAAVRANLRRQQSLKGGKKMGKSSPHKPTLTSCKSSPTVKLALTCRCPVSGVCGTGLLDALGGSTLSRAATIG